MKSLITAVIAAMFSVAIGGPVQAQAPKNPIERGACGLGFVQNGLFHHAALQRTDVQAGSLKVEFVGHSSFLITSPQGVKVVTDYNDFYRADVLPDIATMSGWHQNHTTDTIQPSISHALHGWDVGKGTPRHDVTLKDMRVFSVPTNDGAALGIFRYPSSVFVIQSNGLCIAHMGLTAEVLDPTMVKRLGRIDVLMVPIDRRVTSSFEEIVANIKRINPRIVVPMHYNAEFTVEQFLSEIAKVFPVRRPGKSIYVFERSRLPEKTEVLFMTPPAFSSGF
ncbi:MAG: MBL fold metallo-hydrolase [Proteobacteria bacterium]|nr:MBL fold metallo-hydrolase [Pseudomonadota bacterium]